MDRFEWYAHWRAERISLREAAATRNALTSVNMSRALREIYEFHLPQNEYATYRMLNRYENKISQRLKDMQKRLKIKGKALGKTAFMDNLIYKDNPLLKMVPRGDVGGGHYPVPTIK